MIIRRTLHLRKFVFTLHLFFIVTTISHAQAPGDVHLLAGSAANEGIVEIFDPTTKQWGYICGAGWNQAAGQVACRQLGYEGAIASSPMATAGLVSRPVVLSNVRCRGDEVAITECQHVSFGSQECDPLQISWVICDETKSEQLQADVSSTTTTTPTTTPTTTTATKPPPLRKLVSSASSNFLDLSNNPSPLHQDQLSPPDVLSSIVSSDYIHLAIPSPSPAEVPPPSEVPPSSSSMAPSSTNFFASDTFKLSDPRAKLQLPSPVVTAMSGDQVTIDYSQWLKEVRDMTYFIRVLLKMRKLSFVEVGAADELVVEDAPPFELETELPKFFTHRTVTGLEGRTTYEFVTEVVQLSEEGGETIGHRSGILRVETPCSVPNAVHFCTTASKHALNYQYMEAAQNKTLNANANGNLYYSQDHSSVTMNNHVPGPPTATKLEAQATSGNVLDIRWNASIDKECPATDYVIEYTQTTVGQCVALKNDEVVVEAGITKDTSFRLTGLAPHSTYMVRVTARSEYGASQSAEIAAITPEGAPSGKPRNIVTKYIGEDTLVATWDAPPCEERNGPLTGYSYILVDESSEEVTETGETDEQRLEINGPVAFKKYKILLAAKSQLGKGPYAVKSVTSKADAWHICGRTIEESRNPAQGVTNAKFEARKGDFPWMAQLWHIPRGKLYCAGSILNERWILTATHCIKDKNAIASELKIQLGDYDRLIPEQEQAVYDVEEIITHPDFDYDTFDNDVALIKVSKPIEFTHHIRPICMPPKKLSTTMLQVSSYGTVTGWGKKKESSEDYPRYLKEITVPVRDQATCRRSTTFSITANMFCAGYAEANKGDACEGDSGAPYVMKHSDGRWYVLGIVSWGEGCDEANKFGFYTRLHRYTSWIKRYTRLDILKLLPADLKSVE